MVLDKKVLKEVIGNIIDKSNEELFAKKQEELEDYWFFDFDRKRDLNKYIYEFTKAIELYKSFCRQWEEHHNGSVCVVERVRDTYILPKIRKFEKGLRRLICQK